MSKNASRSNLRNFQPCSGTQRIFWRSLQTCSLSQNMQVLDEAIDRIKREDLLGHIKGAKAVLEVLMCAPLSGDTCRRRSYLDFDRALEIFLSYSAAAVVPEQSKNSDTRKHFREFICSERYGLCVYVYKNTILLRPDDVDL